MHEFSPVHLRSSLACPCSLPQHFLSNPGNYFTKQVWQQREQVLLSELVAVRKQVDKLLQQQELLLSMLLPSGPPKERTSGTESSSRASSSPQVSGVATGKLVMWTFVFASA